MKQTLFAAAFLTTVPIAAMALPTIGDTVGTDAGALNAALGKLGCAVTGVDNADGKIEAICTETASNQAIEVSVDAASGKVVALELADPETGEEEDAD